MRARSALVLTFALAAPSSAATESTPVNPPTATSPARTGPAPARRSKAPTWARRSTRSADRRCRLRPGARAVSRSSSRTATCSTRTASKCRPRSRGRSRSSAARFRQRAGWPLRVEAARRGAHRLRPGQAAPQHRLSPATSRYPNNGEVGAVLEARRERLRRGRSGPVPARRPDDRRPRKRPPRRSAEASLEVHQARPGRCEHVREEDRALRRTDQDGHPANPEARRPDHPQPLPREPGSGQSGDRQGGSGGG